MGILDDAIREHLELKRQHGADESELEGLEAEAFGPAERPDAVETPPPPPEPEGSGGSEALTQVISPGSSLTTPAGEGDQLDKVFAAESEEAAASDEEPSFEEHRIPPAGEGGEAAEAAQQETAAAETAAGPGEEAPGSEAEQAEEDAAGDDAGDALERERQHLAGQPTEHYDVDAALAEEDEIDLLSESSLSEELDRALDGPGDAPPAAEEEPSAEGADDGGDDDADETAADPDIVTGEVVEEEEHDLAEAEFFDQDDPLEGTPDFLEETPEHDRLWFEQKEPKDFDFGD